MNRHTPQTQQQSLTQQNSPILTKIEQYHIQNLENMVLMLCQLMNEFIKIIDTYHIQVTDDLLNFKSIVMIKEANNQLKYHKKINPHLDKDKSLVNQIEQTLQMLAKLKVKQTDNMLPKVRKNYQFNTSNHNLGSQLSTITEKQSQQNLLHNYLKKNLTNKRRSKTNINKNNFLYNTSSIEDLQFEVIREETRKSLDNPYHKNNQSRKGLYNDLQKMKGQDSLLPAVKSYLDKHRKGTSNRLPEYRIQKLI